MSILIGADPELFVKKGRSYVSAHGLIPGTKAEPYKVDKGAVQVDGMALEFNIDPAASEGEFISNINTVLSILKSMVPEHKFHIEPLVHFNNKVVAESPKEALELGCSPDYNAYTGEENPLPEQGGGCLYRTASGHIHIGWREDSIDPYDADHFEACCMLAKQLDFYVGIGSLLFDNSDKTRKRRNLYGKAGAFRPKPYGMEYRTLSNNWITDEALMSWVYRNTVRAFEDLVEGNSAYNKYGQWARAVINKPDHGPNSEAVYEEVLREVLKIDIPPYTPYKKG